MMRQLYWPVASGVLSAFLIFTFVPNSAATQLPATKQKKSDPAVTSGYWGTATLLPFTVPRTGCKAAKIAVDVADPTQINSIVGLRFYISTADGTLVAWNDAKREELGFGATVSLRVCAALWRDPRPPEQQVVAAERTPIKANTTYMFTTETPQFYGQSYASRARFTTGG